MLNPYVMLFFLTVGIGYTVAPKVKTVIHKTGHEIVKIVTLGHKK